jgi:hypothetical protein
MPKIRGGSRGPGSCPSIEGTYAYDWAKRLTSATSPLFGGSATATYRLDGLLETRTFPNGEIATLDYDEARRAIEIDLDAGGWLAQAYDRRGNVTSESRSLTGISGDAGTNSQIFTYDALGRVTGSSGLADTTTYTYG